MAAGAFAALGSEQRFTVLRTLVRAGLEGLAIGVLGARSGIAGSTLTDHLKLLAAAGLVRQTKSGRSVICAAPAYEDLRAPADFLVWECCADALEPSEDHNHGRHFRRYPGHAARAVWRRIDKVWLLIAAIPPAVLLLDPPQAWPTLTFAAGAPLSAVMAFWLSSPLMDPAMFRITAGTLGWGFAVAKTAAALGLGLLGGFGVRALAGSALFADLLREKPKIAGCCGVRKPFSGAPVWRFWQEPERRATFMEAVRGNAVFLLKWLALAYLLEALMLAYVPADAIASVLGGTGLRPILLGALIGAPAYLNGHAAVPLVDALLAQGMTPEAAMSFVLSGGVSCIPAAVAVWALITPRVFAGYLGFALLGSLAAGLIWEAIA